MKELPITLTRYDKPVASIIPVGQGYLEQPKVATSITINPKELKRVLKPNAVVRVDNVVKPKTFWYLGKQYQVDEDGNEKEVL